MPHITQIGAVEMDFGESFSTYVIPRVPLSQEQNKQLELSVMEHQFMPMAVPILEALSNFLIWLSTFKNNGVILVAHSSCVFDSRVVSYAVERTGLQIMFLENVSKFTDSLSLI